MKRILNFIDGKFVPPINGGFMPNYDPALGEVYGEIPDSDAQDIESAIEAADRAFPIWSNMSIQERSRILIKIADLIDERIEELAKAESIDNGKPYKLALKVDIPRASSNFRFFGHAITQYASESHEMVGTAINYTLRKPLGTVACISPWNLPLYLFTWKIAPALASGNTVVAKPSEVTPMTAYLLGKICQDAGMPAGVLNIVHGLGHKTGAVMSTHPKIKALSFTGGTKTGEIIARAAAPLFKKLSLELGGKNPNIIFADCDYEKMLQMTLNSSFSNQGQICLCGSRIFIERSIYDKFKKDFVEQVSQMVVGDPIVKGTRIGAIVSKSHFEKIQSYIELAKEEGGTILTGGHTVSVPGRCEKGWYLRPTVIEGLAFDCRVNQEEIFGPVVTIMPFDTEEEVVDYANSTEYGLSATIWTENLSRAHRMANDVQSGMIWINTWLLRDLRTPFGGMKSSGVGREGGFEALRFFTEPKNICIKY